MWKEIDGDGQTAPRYHQAIVSGVLRALALAFLAGTSAICPAATESRPLVVVVDSAVRKHVVEELAETASSVGADGFAYVMPRTKAGLDQLRSTKPALVIVHAHTYGHATVSEPDYDDLEVRYTMLRRLMDNVAQDNDLVRFLVYSTSFDQPGDGPNWLQRLKEQYHSPYPAFLERVETIRLRDYKNPGETLPSLESQDRSLFASRIREILKIPPPPVDASRPLPTAPVPEPSSTLPPPTPTNAQDRPGPEPGDGGPLTPRHIAGLALFGVGGLWLMVLVTIVMLKDPPPKLHPPFDRVFYVLTALFIAAGSFIFANASVGNADKATPYLSASGASAIFIVVLYVLFRGHKKRLGATEIISIPGASTFEQAIRSVARRAEATATFSGFPESEIKTVMGRDAELRSTSIEGLFSQLGAIAPPAVSPFAVSFNEAGKEYRVTAKPRT